MEKAEIRVKQKRYDELVEAAKQQGCSVEELVDQALTEYIEQPSGAR